MKVITKNSVVNLDNFDSVSYRSSPICNSSYYIEAKRVVNSGGFFGGTETITEELAEVSNADIAQRLILAITKSWVSEEKIFSIQEWLDKQVAKV